MFSLDLESRILSLAQARGLIAPVSVSPNLEVDKGSGSTIWGPKLDSLIETGAVSLLSIQGLAWEVIQQSPPLDFLDSFSLHGGGTMPSEDAQPPCGEGRYGELSLLGEGATGRVYRAFDSVLQRWVALKYLKTSRFDQASLLLKEARAQAKVEHPNICRIYEIGDDQGRPFIAMQLVEGPTLSGACGSMDLATKLAVIRDLAEGIHHAHRKGLVHLDLKPGNVLMGKDEGGGWQPFLSDFGMVRSMEEGEDRFCPMGTPPFSSPEQLAGNASSVDRRSDIYSLGVMIYVLLALRFPFEAESFEGLLNAISAHEVVPLRRHNQGIPEDLEAVVSKCMEKDPTARYDSAQALADDLQRYLDGEPVLARQASPLRLLWQSLKRHRMRILAGGLITAALAATLALWVSAEHTARETRNRLAMEQEQQQRRESEAKALLAELRVKEDQFGLIMEGYASRIARARTAVEAAALMREAEARKAELERELARLRQQAEAVTGRALEAPRPGKTEAPRPPGAPSPQGAPPPAAPTEQQVPQARTESVSPVFVESSKTKLSDLDPAEQARFAQSLATPSPGASQALLPEPTREQERVAEPGRSQVSGLVFPALSSAQLRAHHGTLVKVRAMLDMFGKPNRIYLSGCPPELESAIRESVAKSAFKPLVRNGRPMASSLELTYRISETGVTTQ